MLQYTIRWSTLNLTTVYMSHCEHFNIKKEIKIWAIIECVHKIAHIRYIDLILDICLLLILLYIDFLHDNEFNKCAFIFPKAKKKLSKITFTIINW